MKKTKVYLAVDLGAESGRLVAGLFDGHQLKLEEIHRFPNGPVSVMGRLHWNALGLFAEIKKAIAMAMKKYGPAAVSVGVDTWGVDYGLLDAQGQLLGNPRQYRDPRTNGMIEEACRRVPKADIYRQTGIQFMFFNTIYQLLSEVTQKNPGLGIADRLLFMPDLISYWLTGRKVSERTIASTSQLYDPRRKDWAWSLIKKLGMPKRIFGEIVDPATLLGPLTGPVAEETGAGKLKVVAVGGHDTASAIAAVPASAKKFAYLSSGTWSLMGVESPTPIINDESFRHGFTNEIGLCDTVRVLKNISGLWLLQESRRTWAAQGEELTYAEIARFAGAAKPFTAVINPDYPEFSQPGDMPARIVKYCKKTGQKPPTNKGEIARVILESLALKYRSVMEMFEGIGYRPDVLQIVGGGTQNKLLNQFAANALQRPVITGPIEATSAGNVLAQMLATGDIKSLAEGREIVRRSSDMHTWKPADAAAWDDAYERFLKASRKA